MHKNIIKDFYEEKDLQSFQEDQQHTVLRTGFSDKKIPKSVVKLGKDLEKEIQLFKKFCFKCKTSSKVKTVKDFLVNKYNLTFEYSGFYYRELDHLSKKFRGDYKSVLLVEFQNALYEFYCDYFLLIDKPNKFRQEIIKHSLLLSSSYVMRSFAILHSGYGLSLPLSTLAVHLINPMESLFDVEKASNIKQLKISRALKSLIVTNGLTLSNSFLFTIVKEACSSWEDKNLGWPEKAVFQNRKWRLRTNYLSDSDCGYIGGLFNLGLWGHGTEFPKGHRFSNNMLPILNYRSVHGVTVRPDCLLSILGESIGFTNIVENHVRERLNLPKVGEGQWISEIAILHRVKSLTSAEVVHQWSPSWLGRLRIDVGVPTLKVAIEYNGLQHYKAVDYFGGKDGLESTKRRDKLKKELCKKNKVKLIQIKFDMTEDEIESIIKTALSA